MIWSATQYSKFEAERNRPIQDLLARIPRDTASNAVDMGCGPGNSTALLQERFPQAVVVGMDSSADMVEAARKRLPNIRFDIGDIATWQTPDLFDVILANASLQWVPDHALLIPALLTKLAPGGSLTVQMPNNLQEPAHRLMREIAADGPWSQKLVGVARVLDSRHSADWYYRILSGSSATVDIWQTTYYHPLVGGPASIVEWFKGTALRPFLQPLDASEHSLFLERYEVAIAQAYPQLPDGTVLLPFPRLFFVATC